jgi:RIO kinase 2
MKLDTTYMRYLTPDDWRVLQAVEKGSNNHEVVPTKLIGQIAHLKSGIGNTNKAISDLAKINLISRLRNASYDGYRITYNGFDYVALKTIHQHGNIEELENTIGVGKESDIYSCKTKDGEKRVLKIHRLGRISFRTVRNKRDYLRIGKGGSWMYLSKLAAQKEYEFMSILYHNGFDVPIPYDCSRHLVLMERIEGFPMRQLYEHHNYQKLYSDLMKFAVKLANHGLIHCDYNEYNIMIIEKNNEKDIDIDIEKTKNSKINNRDFVVIDFPQCISIEHPDAEFYFKRDIDCIRRFFKRRFNYKPKKIDDMMLDTDGYGNGFKYGYPIFNRDIKRIDNLDVAVKASGYKRKLNNEDLDLQSAVKSMAIDDKEEEWDSSKEEESGDSEDEGSDYYSDYDSFEDQDEGEENSENDDSEENERIIEALSSGVGELKMDALGNYILVEDEKKTD